jgi:hypothetical protein
MSWNLYTVTDVALAGGLTLNNALNGGYRPLQWALQSVYLKTNIAGYVFDAVIKEEHVHALAITQHPVQTGANITDHAYQKPAMLVLEVGMSDAMASFVPGQWGGGGQDGSLIGSLVNNAVRGLTGGALGELLGVGPGKSVSAHQKLLELQAARTPLQVTTKLKIYRNMLIERIISPVEDKTVNALRCIVVMRQIIIAQVPTTTAKSADPQTTDQTGKGLVQGESPGDSSAARKFEDAVGLGGE